MTPVYRSCSLGISLAIVLEEMVQSLDFSEEEGETIFNEFDRAMSQVLTALPSLDSATSDTSGVSRRRKMSRKGRKQPTQEKNSPSKKTILEGTLVDYNHIISLWKMTVSPVTMLEKGKRMHASTITTLQSKPIPPLVIQASEI